MDPGETPAAIRPCTAQAVDCELTGPPDSANPPPGRCAPRRYPTPAGIPALLLAAARACRTAPVLSGSLATPGANPQPPSWFWCARSHPAERGLPAVAP